MSGIIEITKVDVRIPQVRRNPRLLAFADFVLADALIVRDARIVHTGNGRIRVLMPNRPHRHPCPTCRSGVSHQANYCSHCGEPLPIATPEEIDFHDMVHPAHQRQRDAIEAAVLHAYVDATTVAPLRVISA